MRAVVTGGAGLLGSYVLDAIAGVAERSSLDLRPPASRGVHHVEASILDIDALTRAFTGVDCVLHVAAAANISAGSAERIVELNALGTVNVLEAAHRAGVRRVVLCSSDSVMGNTVWRDFYWKPDTLPVKETHEMRPADPYGLSKLMGEQSGRAYARRGIEVIALRPVFILFPSMMGEVRARHADPTGYRGPSAGGHAPAGGGLCWHHVDARDVASAFRLAMSAPWREYEAFFLAAPSTLHALPTLEIVGSEFGGLPKRVDHDLYTRRPFAPMFSTAAAAEQLGWQAQYDHRATLFGETA